VTSYYRWENLNSTQVKCIPKVVIRLANLNQFPYKSPSFHWHHTNKMSTLISASIAWLTTRWRHRAHWCTIVHDDVTGLSVKQYSLILVLTFCLCDVNEMKVICKEIAHCYCALISYTQLSLSPLPSCARIYFCRSELTFRIRQNFSILFDVSAYEAVHSMR